MAKSQLARTIARFEARVHDTKNRLIAIPADVQRTLGLSRRRDNHIVSISIRPKDRGRWNHHLFKLTYDNEFAIPSDVSRFRSGDLVEVKVHGIVADVDIAATAPAQHGAEVLLAFAETPARGWREDGAARLDEYLSGDSDA